MERVKGIEPIELPIDLAVPCGLMLNEVLANAYEHAFGEEDSRKVTVSIHEVKRGLIQLSVSDNGCGLPGPYEECEKKSFGLILIRTLTRQLRGELSFDPSDGACFEITFPLGQDETANSGELKGEMLAA